MAEEIKIVVKQEAEGTAIKDAQRDAEKLQQTQRKAGSGTGVGASNLTPEEKEIARLRKAAEGYESKGMFGAAASARREAAEAVRKARVGVAREIFNTDLQAQELRAGGKGKEAEALEKANEIRKRAVQIEHALMVSRAEATKLAEREAAAASKGGGNGGSNGLLRAIIGGGLITHGIERVLRLGGRFYEDRVESQQRSAAIAATGIESSNRLGQIGGMAGMRGEQESLANWHQKRAALEAEQAKAGTFDNYIGGTFDQLKNVAKNLGFSGIETDADRLNRENHEKIQKLTVEEAQAKKQAQQKFRDGLGMMELNLEKARATGDIKGANSLEMELVKRRAHDEAFERSGSEDYAKEAADVAVLGRRRQIAQAFARNLGDVRSGNTAIANVARQAGYAMGGNYDPSSLGAVHHELKLVNNKLGDQIKLGTEAFRKKFSRF